ncbi:UNVERIFIED_CONTAM: hypothetical protein FKN15_052546 [Acipenser sinensis]
MEVEIQELRLQLKRQCLRNKELEFQIQELDIHDEHSSTECDHEVRNSRTVAIAPEPLQEYCDNLAQGIQKSFSTVSWAWFPAGELRVTQGGRVLRTLSQGDVFGELAILYNCKRTATVTAITNVQLWCIERQTYRAIMTNKSKRKREQIMGFLKTTVSWAWFPAGELRVTQGGRVLRTLSQGDVFGELAILYNCKRTATVTAITNVQLWCIERQTYRAIMTNKSKRKREQIMGFLKTGVFTNNSRVCTPSRLEELVPVLYQEGQYQGEPVTLGVGGFGRVKLVDFGFAKELTRGVKTYSFCGTPEYLAPEIIQNEGHDFAADFWSLGILVYELLSGSPPFSSSDPQKVYSKILDGIIKFPHYMGEGARSLISKLCRWFSKINWQKLQAGQIEAPTIPLIRMGSPYINFDRFPPEITKAEEEFSGWDKDF